MRIVMLLSMALTAVAATAQNTFPSTGNVGIGTTAPIRPLTINNGDMSLIPYTSNSIAYFNISDVTGNNGGNYSLQLRGLGSNGTAGVNFATFSIFANTTSLFGNVGVGTASPRSGIEVTPLDGYYPSTTITSFRVGGINPGPSGVALSGVSTTYQILFSSYRDVQSDTVGAKIAAINNAVYSAGGAGNYWRVQNTDIAFSTLSTTPTSTDSTTEKMRLTAAGNLGIGTATPGATLEVGGTAKIDNGLYFPGSSTPQTTPWTGVLCGGDYAEAVTPPESKQQYGPGDVLVLAVDKTGSVEKSTQAYSTMVAGIYATKPGVIGRRQSLPEGGAELPMAMVGIVPTKVSAENGSIHQGDLLVSTATPGFAMRGTDRSRMLGAVIGEATKSFDSGSPVIEVLVTFQ